MKKIKNKLLLVLIIVTLVPAILIGGYSLYSTSKVLRENILASHVNKVSLIQERIESLFSGVDGDLFFLRDSNALHLYLSATESEGSHTQRLLLSNLRSSLKKFSDQKKIYQQVRFLNTDGQEIVRIDRIDGKSKNISDTHLQNKSSRDYFINTVELDKDDQIISPMELNRENGKLTKPIQPIIRYSTPVYDKAGSLSGIIVLNIDASLITNLISKQNEPGEKLIFIDPQGFYYYHSGDESKAWGRKQDLGTGENLFKENSGIVGHLKKVKRPTHVELQDDIIVYNPISIQQKEHALGTLLSIHSKKSLFKPLKDYLMIFLGIGLLALLLALMLAIVLSNSITRPLVKLKESVVNLSQGDMDSPIEVTTKDEIGDVAHAIELLRKSMNILMKRSR